MGCKHTIFVYLTLFYYFSLLTSSNLAGNELKPVRRYVGPCTWQTLRVSDTGKTFPSLGSGDSERLNKAVSTTAIKKLLEGYVDRIENKCIDKFQASKELITWLKANPDARKAFWLALNSHYDDIKQAIRIFDTLRKENPKKILKYYHLAIAIAVVWDTPDAITSSRWTCIWGYKNGQFKSLLGFEEVFNYFTNPKYQKYFVFKPDQLRWPLMTHLVDLDIDQTQLEWALKNYNSKKRVIHRTYRDVKYDYQKLSSKKPNMGSAEYTLQNILKYGGICGDQSHFASRIAKSFGIPSMKVSGEGRHGGSGHAWAGYLIAKKGRPLLEFTGRYRGDYYYTGDVFDPQTRTMGLERFVAMMYDGASSNYEKYIDSLALSRIAGNLKKSSPELSLKLTQEALKLNSYCGPAWILLMDHVSNGTADKKVGTKWFNVMVKKLMGHPDMTIICFKTLLTCVPEDDIKTRQKYYNTLFLLYQKRPDLQIRLRTMQCQELSGGDQALLGLNLAVKTCIANGKEGALILPLVKQCIDIAKAKKLEDKVRPYLKKIKFPQKRGNKTSKAFAMFKKLLDSL